MIEKLFDVEGPLIGTLDKLGQLIALSVLWLIGCIPVVTFFTSSSALYYGVCKSVRHGQGSAVKEFFRSYRANLRRGIVVSLCFGGVLAVLICLLAFARSRGIAVLYGMAAVSLLLMGFAGCLLSPVMSRFRLSVLQTVRLTCLMAFRHAPEAALLLLGTVLAAVLQLRVLPMPTVLILPGAWTWAVTFVAERLLRRYMPSKTENDNAWYYEN